MDASVNNEGRLYILSEYVDSERNSTGYYWAKIIEGFAGVPGGVNVISTRTSIRLCPPRDQVRYIEMGDQRGYQKNKLISRILGQLSLSLSLCMAVARHVRRGDVLFSGTNPAFAVIFIALLKRVLGFRWVLLVHDVFPENLVPAGILKPRSPAYMVLKLLFDAIYRQADCLVAIGRDMQGMLEAKTKGIVEVAFIPNWVDASDLRAGAPTPQSRSGIQRNFQFFGNMGRVQGLDTLLEAIRRLQASNVRFTFIGSGASEHLVQEFVDANQGLPVEKHPPLPFSQNSAALFDCDVAIISLRQGMRGLAVPSKAYFSMAADKPLFVIGDAGSELHEVIRENPEIGWFCAAGDVDGICAALRTAMTADLAALRGRPLSLATTVYSYESAMEKYRSLVAKLRTQNA